MTEIDARRERIRQKVAASQERLKRDGDTAPAAQRMPNLPDAYPPENYRTLASEYPLLTVGLGLGLGLLAGALLPKRKPGLLGKRAIALATAATELALALGKQARDEVIEAERDAPTRLIDAAEPARRQATRLVRSARNHAVDVASGALREGARLVAQVRSRN
ncbi:hypothetical protein B0I00_0447 [Novosphingobium kunmingense]|uniref:Uncharacterized protein n=1 Tax=Novosphingobium kunmingense TaxID=1211806 RepID=A0A2N0I243_9SPHN|nr:hypothetical protein [Novosphingobium kunmingense]PKB25254.1 hypothetical protein B0I00_0447 [Novosphingobium kunmingense]